MSKAGVEVKLHGGPKQTPVEMVADEVWVAEKLDRTRNGLLLSKGKLKFSLVLDYWVKHLNGLDADGSEPLSNSECQIIDVRESDSEIRDLHCQRETAQTHSKSQNMVKWKRMWGCKDNQDVGLVQPLI